MTQAVKKAGRWTKLRAKLTYANVMSTLAGFLALATGGAYAADRLAKDSVDSKQIKKGAVASSEVKQSSLVGADVKDGSLDEGELSFTALRFGDIISRPVFVASDEGENAITLASAFKTIGTTTIAVASRSQLHAEGDIRVVGPNPGDGDAKVTFRLVIDGNALPGTFTNEYGTDFNTTVPVSFSTLLEPGSHVIEFQAQVSAGDSAIIGTRSFDAVARKS